MQQAPLKAPTTQAFKVMTTQTADRMALSEPWWSEYILTGGVAVYHIDLAASSGREAEAVATLNKEEVERWRRYHSGGPRRRYALCRAALRTILCQALGCENSALDFHLMAYGKPIALTNGVPAEINFNVSHSGDHGLIAISKDSLVGVDIEDRATRFPLDSLIEASLSPHERKELSLLDVDAQDRVFLDRWTIKEAIIKMRLPFMRQVKNQHGHRGGRQV